jgi:hypothetical protein
MDGLRCEVVRLAGTGQYQAELYDLETGDLVWRGPVGQSRVAAREALAARLLAGFVDLIRPCWPSLGLIAAAWIRLIHPGVRPGKPRSVSAAPARATRPLKKALLRPAQRATQSRVQGCAKRRKTRRA